MSIDRWRDRRFDGVPPVPVHVLEGDRTLCGADRGPGDITRDGYRTRRFAVDVCARCEDVIWGLLKPAR